MLFIILRQSRLSENHSVTKFPFLTDIDECDKVNGPNGRCGQNAVCTNTPGSFVCQCPPGFSGNPINQCNDIDECAKPDSCGLGAVCKNLPGSYTCECPEGTIPDPDPKTKCNEIVTCDGDSDCPGNAICDNKKRCLCPEPNIGNDCRRKLIIIYTSNYKNTELAFWCRSLRVRFMRSK